MSLTLSRKGVVHVPILGLFQKGTTGNEPCWFPCLEKPFGYGSIPCFHLPGFLFGVALFFDRHSQLAMGKAFGQGSLTKRAWW